MQLDSQFDYCLSEMFIATGTLTVIDFVLSTSIPRTLSGVVCMNIHCFDMPFAYIVRH
jgi:hypothetical protein